MTSSTPSSATPASQPVNNRSAATISQPNDAQPHTQTQIVEPNPPKRDRQSHYPGTPPEPATLHFNRQPAWTRLIGAGLRLRNAARRKKLDDTNYWATQTHRIQTAQLRSLLVKAMGTDYGKAHHFKKLAALSDDELPAAYRKQVPAQDWYAFKDRIARMRENAEPNVLWPGLVKDFCQTSGTTAGDKFIPLSKQMYRSNYLAAMDIFANLDRFGVDLPHLTRGKCLFLGGSSDIHANQHGIRTADLSGLATELIRWPISEVYAPGRQIALMNDWPAKIEAMAEWCIQHDIRMVNGMPSWAHVLFERVLQLAKQRNLRAADGNIPTCISQLWTNLRVFVHGGVKYSPFEARLREVFSGSPTGDDFPTRLELYPASEAFIAMQDTPNDPGLRLLTDIGNYYEFIPLEHIDDPDPPAFLPHQAEPGVRYVVCMSTCAGLWRYIIGDVVQFDTTPAGPGGTGGFGNKQAKGGSAAGPARLRIVGRHRHFINAFGENLIVEHIENAVAHAAATTSLTVGEFTAAPVYPSGNTQAGLQLAVELKDHPNTNPQTLQTFADAFDQSLKSQNVDYATKRSGGLGMTNPTITSLPIGAFHHWMASRGKLGGQHKCPRCANHRDIIDAVITESRKH